MRISNCQIRNGYSVSKRLALTVQHYELNQLYQFLEFLLFVSFLRIQQNDFILTVKFDSSSSFIDRRISSESLSQKRSTTL